MCNWLNYPLGYQLITGYNFMTPVHAPTFVSMKGTGLSNMGTGMISVLICLPIAIAIANIWKMGAKRSGTFVGFGS